MPTGEEIVFDSWALLISRRCQCKRHGVFRRARLKVMHFPPSSRMGEVCPLGARTQVMNEQKETRTMSIKRDKKLRQNRTTRKLQKADGKLQKMEKKQTFQRIVWEIQERLEIQTTNLVELMLAFEKAAEISPPEKGQPFSSSEGRLKMAAWALAQKFGLDWSLHQSSKEKVEPKAKPIKIKPPPKNKLPKKDKFIEFYESFAWRQIRYTILVKYGRTCMACGETKGIMHVDHIKPLRHHWDLRVDENNLQVLCPVCNHGKASWDQTDFRPKPAKVIRLVREE